MTSPGDTPESVALRNLEREMADLRSMVHEEMAGIRKDISAMSERVRSQTEDLQPRMARIEERVTSCEADIVELKTQRTDDRGIRWRMWAALAGGVAGPAASGVIVLLGG